MRQNRFEIRLVGDFGNALPLVLPVRLREQGGVTEIVAAGKLAR